MTKLFKGTVVEIRTRIFRFIAMSAWDIFVPDIISHPVSLVQNFYECFLVADPLEKLSLLKEAEDLSPDDIEAIVEALSTQLQPYLPGQRLTDEQRGLMRRLITCLKAASESSEATDPSEVLRKSLNKSVLGGERQQLAYIHLKPDQLAVGRSMVRAGLLGHTDIRGPHPLPYDAPAIPGYELQSVLGEGGFSKVYLATETDSRQLRALKVGLLDDKVRLNREIGLLKTLKSPYIVKCYDHGELPGRFWIALEYLGTFTLSDLIRTRLEPDTALLIAEQILQGLVSLHEAGVIHRDLTPFNVMVDPQFRLKLIDFGLAKPLSLESTQNSTTRTVGLTGTPLYMSPEQIHARNKLTPSSDLWSFGVILYEMLVGSPPFVATNIMALGHEINTANIDVNNINIPIEIHEFLERCLNRDIAQRWASASAAFPEYVSIVREARQRIRYERYRESWGLVLEKRLLQRFANEASGQLTDSSPTQFIALAHREGIKELDEERLDQIIAPILFHQSQIESATKALQDAKSQLSQNATRLSSDQLACEIDSIRKLEQTVHLRQSELDPKVASLLAEELQSWEEDKRKRHAQQQAIEAMEQAKKALASKREQKEHEVKRAAKSGSLISMITMFLFCFSFTANYYYKYGIEIVFLITLFYLLFAFPFIGYFIYYKTVSIRMNSFDRRHSLASQIAESDRRPLP